MQEIDSVDLLPSGLGICAHTVVIRAGHDYVVSEEADSSDSAIEILIYLIDRDVDLGSHTFRDAPLKDVSVGITILNVYGVLEELDVV